MEEQKKNKNNNIFLSLLLIGVLAVVAMSFYSFYYQKNYDFFVETNCDPDKEICFYRDCEGDPDICPPNNLSYYNQYTINAKDFELCLNEDCTQVCSTGAINCVKTECTVEDTDAGICTTPPVNTEIDTDINTEI